MNVWLIAGTGACLGLALTFLLAWMAMRRLIVVRLLVRVVAAFFLMFPVVQAFKVLTYNTPMDDVDFYMPWLKFLSSLGFNGGGYLFVTFFVGAFLIAIPLSWLIEKLFRLVLPQQSTTLSA